ncbi:MAG: quinone oxidoreductase family protein [Candidatus Hodarchaeales archaeon]
MKAIVLDKTGGPEVLKVSDIPEPRKPSAGEVLIHLKAAGVNFAETMARRGIYGWVPSKTGFVLGLEGSGTVVSAGTGVTAFKPGDPVITVGNNGCYAEFIKVNQKQVYPAISSYNHVENAAFTASFLTAYISLVEMARVRNGESLLVQAAAGGLGTAAVMLGKVLGLKVAGTSSREKKLSFLRNKLDIDLAINYKEEKFSSAVLEWTNGRGVDNIIESVGGKVFKESLLCLAPLGRIVVVGVSSIRFSRNNPLTWLPAWKAIPKISIRDMIGKSQAVMAFHAGRLMESDISRLKDKFSRLVTLVEEHGLKPVIDSILPLEKAADAHQKLESRANLGKIVLKI